MAFGASSAMFQAWPQMMIGNFGANAFVSLEEDSLKVALFNDTTTPDKDAAIASTGFNTGVWTTGNQVTDATNWVSGGRVLAGVAATDQGSGITMLDATDLAGGGTVTITNAYGCMVYDDTITAGTGGVIDQGITYHSFGGGQTVTAGTFTIVWHANGLFRITV